MNKLNLICQKYTIEKGGKSYSYYLGAGEASSLEKVAVAPSFQIQTPHREIVDEILKPPSTHWQRPLDQGKADQITLRFEDDQEIMPNPILLAVNPDSKIQVQQFVTPGGSTTSLYEVIIDIPESSTNLKPRGSLFARLISSCVYHFGCNKTNNSGKPHFSFDSNSKKLSIQLLFLESSKN